MITSLEHLSDQGFVEFCYQQILSRQPDDAGRNHYLSALRSGRLTREGILTQFVTCEEYKRKSVTQEFVPTGHFFSAIASAQEREAFIMSDSPTNAFVPGVALNTEKQLALLGQFKAYHDECPFPEHRTEPFRYYFANPAYAHADALALYSMLRHFAPKRVIEIGSGFSSCVMLDTNDRFLNGDITFTFIEPYPELLYSLLKESDQRHKIIPTKAQDLDQSIFGELEANDILFVDSTHVSKLNSDVNKIVFEILPSLKIGTLIHFHDIFWCFEYPKDWIREGRAWNEAYILRAFLEFNDHFEIIFFSDYLLRTRREWFREQMPLYLRNTGGNIWLRRVKD
jgi:predicted O-methyltransferase YrrM